MYARKPEPRDKSRTKEAKKITVQRRRERAARQKG